MLYMGGYFIYVIMWSSAKTKLNYIVMYITMQKKRVVMTDLTFIIIIKGENSCAVQYFCENRYIKTYWAQTLE